jgi:NitT/TauT family transport system substrate-binding protein
MKTNKTILLSIIVVAIIVLIISGIFLSRQKAEPIKIGIIVYPGFAPFFIADEQGFFDKQTVNAEVVLINDPDQAISLLESNNVQMLFSSADFTPIIADVGVDVKEIFAADIGYGSDGLLAKNDVSSIRELKGKTVYLGMGYPSHFLLRFLTKQAGLKNEDITLVEMGADQVGAAFVAGQIDYGMSWEPWLSQVVEREDGQILFSSKDYPGIITDTFVVRTDVLESRRNDIKAVTRAWFDSIDYIETNPDEANEIMARNLGLPLEDFEAMVLTIKFLDYNENLAKFDKSLNLNMYELTEKAVEIYTEEGILQTEIDYEGIVDSTILEELY